MCPDTFATNRMHINHKRAPAANLEHVCAWPLPFSHRNDKYRVTRKMQKTYLARVTLSGKKIQCTTKVHTVIKDLMDTSKCRALGAILFWSSSGSGLLSRTFAWPVYQRRGQSCQRPIFSRPFGVALTTGSLWFWLIKVSR